MYRILLISLFAFINFSVSAQILNPVKWTTSSEKLSNDEYALIFNAKIDKGWTVYSQFIEEGGPVPTSFTFEEGGHYSLIGKAEESDNAKTKEDEIFEMTVTKFYDYATFTQKVKSNDKAEAINGYFTYMVCDNSRCLPPTDIDFSFDLSEAQGNNETKEEKSKTEVAAVENIAIEEVQKAEQKIEKTTLQETASQTVKETKERVIKSASTQSKKTEQKKQVETKQKLPASNNAVSKVEAVKDKTTSSSSNIIATGSIGGENKGKLLDPVKWKLDLLQNGDTYQLDFNAFMQKGWTIYSQFIEGDGPIPSEFGFDEGDHFELIGKVSEYGKKKEGPDPVFGGINVIKFVGDKATFSQKLKISDPAKSISGYLYFMSCDDKQCLPPRDIPFKFNVAGKSMLLGEAATAEESSNEISSTIASASASSFLSFAKPEGAPIGTCDISAEEVKGKSMWTIFILGFLGGLLALLTPCVFPMIPLTVSFFTKSKEGKGLRDAILYGFFIFLVYLLFSLPFHLLDGINPAIFNEISTNVWLNIAFFAIFVFFAFSFFGYYEISLPSSFANKASSAEGAGGIIGIFFMALTLAIVSFSCTGPILGSLLVGALSSDGGAFQLTAGMGGFGLALALPFAIFAAFPALMTSLPKSGGWLNTVKVVLGFMELALAFKFLSNADLVERWGLLKIEPYLIIWAIIAFATALYLIGKIKFPHDSPIKKMSFMRISTAVLFATIGIYMLSGFRYDKNLETFKPLTLLSGINPPVGYSWLHPKSCPSKLQCFKDFEKGMAYAKEANKPVLLDFTGYACFNCRKMEENVWPQPGVYEKINENYVLISLYVDDKKDLPEDQQITVERAIGGKKKLTNYGHKWSHFQTEYFETNTQPYYVLLSPEGELLTNPVGYTPNISEYSQWLECGIDAFDGQIGQNLQLE